MVKLPDYETMQIVGWIFLSFAILNLFVPYEDKKQKFVIGMIFSLPAVIFFLINMLFNT